MRLYICQTLDGYIADPDGGIDFLSQFDSEIAKSSNSAIANSYPNFFKNIKTIVQGYTTYNQIKQLGYGDIYRNHNHYVLTNNHQDEVYDNVTAFLSFDQLQRLNLDNQTTFLVGGSQVIREALKREMITEITVTQLPIFLGNGIKLFDNIELSPHLEITNIESDKRFFEVTYSVQY